MSLPLKEWILVSINPHGACSRGDAEWLVTFAAFCWLIWKRWCGLLLDDHSQRIEETILVEVGGKGHEVTVLELGFRDGTIDPLCQSEKAEIPVEPTESQSESSSEFSSD
ncbi:hypothetical protein V6N12_037558 [Hibiscus sabdariffa]|uniref:Uncharacterized protein n=2 Tax=Hibiscus sabdariffa TaxID=183260 RepID=A0ABR2A8U3_9ROSI